MDALPQMNFEILVQNPNAFREIMKYNCAGVDASYQEWSDKRKFIADSIPGDGTILDIGCAGGFFLCSLQEWSGHALDPYGIDFDPALLEEAKKLFPKIAEHFAVLNAYDIQNLSAVGLPTTYDFVYISVINLHSLENIEFIRNSIMPLATKRLIIGFYGANAYKFDTPEWQKERSSIEEGIRLLQENIMVSGTKFNPTKFNQAIAWIDI